VEKAKGNDKVVGEEKEAKEETREDLEGKEVGKEDEKPRSRKQK